MIDIIARGMIEESNGDISQISEKVNNHTEDSDIHVTVNDKENWNSHPNDVMASGNPVVMDGLQGGVPFSEITVSGKNLIPFPYYETTKTVNGITFTDNGDGTIAVDGTASSDAVFYFANKKDIILSGNSFYLSGCPVGGSGSTYDIVFVTFDENNTTISVYNDVGNGKRVTVSENAKTVNIYIRIRSGQTISNLIFHPQLELGSNPTEYEPPITGRELTVNVNGTEYTITPDSNPYVIPNDIRQVEGLNNISVSEGEISVTGVRKNAAVKKIWDEIGMDLLFDGTVTTGTNCITENINGYNFLYFYGNLSSVSGESGNVTGSLVIPKTARAISAGQSLVVTTGVIYITVNIINIESGVITFTVTPSDSNREIHEFKVFGIK